MHATANARLQGLRITGGTILLAIGFVGVSSTYGISSLIQAFGQPLAIAITGASCCIGIVASKLGWSCLNHARKLRAVSHLCVVPDAKYSVLYLRPFDTDHSFASPPNLAFQFPFIISTVEENIVSVLNEIGPVIAIGKPGEALPQLGARRMYVPVNGDEDEDRWKKVVAQAMSTARLVMFVVGDGGGEHFWWEVEQALTCVERHRLLFFIPKKNYGAFRERGAALDVYKTA